ncbi:hypothetical protein, partial [Mesorhizobium sp.]|uniref:hypothetical protein n=1 Tax=Mesorhizobium sp. TaxID=1871066 RepID=UPI0025C43799
MTKKAIRSVTDCNLIWSLKAEILVDKGVGGPRRAYHDVESRAVPVTTIAPNASKNQLNVLYIVTIADQETCDPRTDGISRLILKVIIAGKGREKPGKQGASLWRWQRSCASIAGWSPGR